MRKLAIITARGGSKRIPRKNIRDFMGQPIIAYAIKTAIEAGLFDEVMVSTDDEEIASVARTYGAVVPFMRSDRNSNDFATTSEVLIEVLETYRNKGIDFTYACCIYPCTPLLTGATLQQAFEKLQKEAYTCIMPIMKYGYPIWRSLQMNEQAQLSMIWPEHMDTRSQDLPPVFYDAGQFYFFDVQHFLNVRKFLIGRVGGILVDEMHAQDIDNEDDWKLAELKYTLLKGKRTSI